MTTLCMILVSPGIRYGDQPVVANAVKATGQNVQKEAPHVRYAV